MKVKTCEPLRRILAYSPLRFHESEDFPPMTFAVTSKNQTHTLKPRHPTLLHVINRRKPDVHVFPVLRSVVYILIAQLICLYAVTNRKMK